MYKAKLQQILDFAHRKKIPIDDIQSEIDKYYFDKDLIEKNPLETINDQKIKEIITNIHQFSPLLDYYHFELPYQIDLARYLKNIYPNTQIELQKGSSRPDIIIEDIAIEIKGPTGERELQTIADKCSRYPQHFKRGFIIVLFDVKATHQFYSEWETGIQNTYPNVQIIKK
jgi:hypothetical protein